MVKSIRRMRIALLQGLLISRRHFLLYVLSALTITGFYIAYSRPGSSSDPVTFMQRPIFVSEDAIRLDQYTIHQPSLASASFSKLHVKNGNIFDLGEKIHVKIQLFDGYGRPKNRGGDLVRLWLRDISMSACSAGHVIDNNDGTYSGVVKTDWVGRPEIIAAIAGSRESIKILYEMLYDHKTIKHINAVYVVQEEGEDSKIEEAPCLPSPDVPGATQVCNFTAENYGLPWYCGQPKSHGVTCFDWQYIVVHNNSGDLPLTKEESVILSRENVHTQLPPHQIWVKNTESDKYSQPDSTIPCNQRQVLETWGDVSPVGYFYNWVWFPAHCQQTIETIDDYNICLRDRKVLIYGDSTTRQWFVHLRKVLGLTMTTEMFEDSQPWHKPCLAVNPTHNYSVFWGPHEMPFYGGPNRGFNRPTYVYLDEVPNNSRDIVIIHYYLHFVSYHPNVYMRHIRRLYQSVESLISRAPNVTVAIKGPHALKQWTGRLNDYWGPVYDNIIRNVFRPLMDKVLYLDFWDMTMASENEGMHPNETVVANMVHYMLNTACRKMIVK